MIDLFLKSRKVHRFFERRFLALEERLKSENLAANVPAERPSVTWHAVPECASLDRFYAFHDQTCPDVLQMTGETWWRSHFFGRYPLHAEAHEHLSYRYASRGDAMRFTAPAENGDCWIYLISRDLLPTRYALSFDYTPHAVFKEQLQLDFAATSLADRHRYILSMNEKLRYQRIERGFWLPDVANRPWSLPLDRPTHIRLEVVDRSFVLLANDETIAAWCDRRYRPRPSRNMLLFWNGGERRDMDFEIANFRYEVPAT